jgi:mRNA deadenylase 3'-5' endonuclease subunit Ccr4
LRREKNNNLAIHRTILPLPLKPAAWENGRKKKFMTNPPTLEDFQNFFAAKAPQHGHRLIFWSGVTKHEAQQFAALHGRTTLETLLGNNWAKYQEHGAGKHWLTEDAAIAGFWDLAAQAFAEIARGSVFVYMMRDAAEDQKVVGCNTCWYRVEKPVLLRRRKKNGGDEERMRTRIQLYMHPYRQGDGGREINAQDE